MSKKNSLKRRAKQREFEMRKAREQSEQLEKKKEKRNQNKQQLEDLTRLAQISVSGSEPTFQIGKFSEVAATKKKEEHKIKFRGSITKVRKTDQRRQAKVLKRALQQGRMAD